MKGSLIEKNHSWKICGLIIGIICIMVISIIYSQHIKTNRLGLKSWVGEYSFNEDSSQAGYPSMFMEYSISIYEEKQGRFFADIEINGQTTLARIKGKVYGDGQWIGIVFEGYLPEHIAGGIATRNGVLFSFRKDKENIYTYWGEIQPMLYENQESGRIYFIKE